MMTCLALNILRVLLTLWQRHLELLWSHRELLTPGVQMTFLRLIQFVHMPEQAESLEVADLMHSKRLELSRTNRQ